MIFWHRHHGKCKLSDTVLPASRESSAPDRQPACGPDRRGLPVPMQTQPCKVADSAAGRSARAQRQVGGAPRRSSAGAGDQTAVRIVGRAVVKKIPPPFFENLDPRRTAGTASPTSSPSQYRRRLETVSAPHRDMGRQLCVVINGSTGKGDSAGAGRMRPAATE